MLGQRVANVHRAAQVLDVFGRSSRGGSSRSSARGVELSASVVPGKVGQLGMVDMVSTMALSRVRARQAPHRSS